jgi:hypothetical protein
MKPKKQLSNVSRVRTRRQKRLNVNNSFEQDNANNNDDKVIVLRRSYIENDCYFLVTSTFLN